MDFQVLPPLFHPNVFFTLVLTNINITLSKYVDINICIKAKVTYIELMAPIYKSFHFCLCNVQNNFERLLVV